MKRPDLSREELLVKMQGWCAADERCSADVRRKLRELGAIQADSIFIVDKLICDNFIDDARFASLYVRSKINSRHWGRRRIEAELRQRQIALPVIRDALQEIDDDAYFATLVKLAGQKADQVDGNDFAGRRKVFRYLIQKGYEPQLIGKALNWSPDEIEFTNE
ncbi:MAG TPA: RecX family transcriptional regulator [Bacteroidales bacterium]|nr:MAG: RecX family transcriptional regulator [Bacteroidetes bacterium HGW-Bacteroidetes-22]HAQ65427.1 RecX family transcriptional regulator [Bacteroidales bacterium]HBZ66980.1 RecX family transcriptional regulator [Bacteroidales bacterium]